MTGGLYDLALSVPWCITDGALEAMLSIAARDPLPADEIAARMHGPKALATRRDAVARGAETMAVRDGVAIIPIDGPIYRYANLFSAVSGGRTTEAIARDMQIALDDPAIAAIVLAIDSPGGEATGINELASMIYAARGTKPITAYVEGFGASAAYWIASAASRVYVDATALVGSIGTVMGVPDPTKRIARTIDFVSSQSPRKRPDPTTDEGRAYLQQLVDDMTTVFLDAVALHRGMTPDAVAQIGGGLLVGQQAVDAGLADGLASEEALIAQFAHTSTPAAAWRIRMEEGSTMTLKDGQTDDKAPAVASTDDPRVAELQGQVRALRAQLIDTAALRFADEAINAGRALPAEHGALAALYRQCAADDAERPLDETRVAALSALLAARPSIDRTRELVPQSPLAALTLDTGRDDPRAAARAQGEAYAKKMNR